jgi:molecular chaperone IbpA
MTTLSLGRPFPPSFVGFDRLFNELDRVQQHREPTYPPHNIVKAGDDKYIIELAVAGYQSHELDIETHEGVLTITGNIVEAETKDYEKTS